MKKICISDNWLLSAPGCGEWQSVSLPNDYAVTQKRQPDAPGGASNGFFNGGRGVYIRYLTRPADRHCLLAVDGAYQCAHVFCNETLIAMHPYGYTPFLCDLTPYLFKDPDVPNKLVIETDDMQPSTRWYSGAGLFRDVFLWTGGDIRIEPRDVFVTTPDTDGTVFVSCTVTADRTACTSVSLSVTDTDGKCCAGSEQILPVKEGKNALQCTLHLDHPQLWSPDTPYLYTLHAILTENGEPADTFDLPFGIRTVTADAKNGLLLNGRPLKLRGGCIHHDHGVLGAAAFPDAEKRKIRKLREAGFNAVRTAHNPPSEAFLTACDRLGMLVMDEAFDMWTKPKNARDYHLWFFDRWEKDLADMVLRDRVHPSVISYSIGNEVPESSGTADGAAWSAKMAAAVRRYDPTRLVSASTWGMPFSVSSDDPEAYQTHQKERFLLPDDPDQTAGWAKRTADFFAPLDIAGYNYLFERYKEDHERFPERVIWGSETHAIRFYDSWKTVMECPHVIGDFTWTAWDNMGEAGTGRSAWEREETIRGISLAQWPWRTCYQGDFDLCGYRRPQSYFRKSIWCPGAELQIFTTHPEHFEEGFSGTGWHFYDVLDTWTYPDAFLGKPVRCEVYTDADFVVWTLNGREAGRSVPEKNIAFCNLPYEKGSLRAKAWKNGVCVGSSELHTVGTPAKILLTPETDSLCADGRSLCYIDVTVADADGNRIPDAEHLLRCSVKGGLFRGIFSGNPQNEDAYGSDTCHAFYGRALLIVSAEHAGDVSVTVSSDTLGDTTIFIAAQKL